MMNKNKTALALYRSDFLSFIGFAFRELHSNKSPILNWHIDLMANRLEGVLAGGIRRLMINVPPRSLKSISGSIALPAFLLGNNPTKEILLVTGNQQLGNELRNKLWRLMTSARYRSVFPHVQVRQAAGGLFSPHGGFIRFAVVGQQLSGRSADLIIIDDPLSPVRARDAVSRNAVNTWFDGEILTRLNDRAAGALIILMQRVHSKDLCGHLLSHNLQFEQLSISAIATCDEAWEFADGRKFERWRGGVLQPRRESRDQLLVRLHEIGAFNFISQYLQGGFHRWTEQEHWSAFLWEVAEDWVAGDEPIGGGLYKFSVLGDVEQQVFGIGKKRRFVHDLQMTPEVWSARAVAQQRKLIEECQRGG